MTPDDDAALLIALAQLQRDGAPSLAFALSEVERTRYYWRPDDVHVTWDEVRRRGYAACGEAAAFLAAAAMRDGYRDVRIVVEGGDGPCGPHYRHAVVYVEGFRLDPYAAHACPVTPRPLVERLAWEA